MGCSWRHHKDRQWGAVAVITRTVSGVQLETSQGPSVGCSCSHHKDCQWGAVGDIPMTVSGV